MDKRFNLLGQKCKAKYIKLILLLLTIVSLSLLISYKHVMADGDGNVLKNLLPGAKLTASLDGEKTDPPLRLIEKQGEAVVKEMIFVKPEPPYGPIEDITIDESFRVKFVYNRTPNETTRPVVELESELTDIPIKEEGKPTDDPLIFITDTILVEDVVDKHGSDIDPDE